MVKFTNKLTGNAMWVSEERTEEYKAAGHKLAASSDIESPPAKKTKKTKKKVK